MTSVASARQGVRPSYQASPFVYRIMKALITALMHLLYRYRLTRLGEFPTSGPVIIIVNHLHLFDPGAVVPAVRRQIVTLVAGKWREHPIIRRLMKLAGAIFVRRGEVDRTALKACLDVLRNDGVLAIAPEGTRSKTGGLQRAKPGVAYLAARTQATIVPIAFWGTEKFSEWKRLKRPTCRVVVGQPFRLPVFSKKLPTEQLQELTDLMMIRLGAMLPESYRGVYAERIAEAEAGKGSELALLPV